MNNLSRSPEVVEYLSGEGPRGDGDGGEVDALPHLQVQVLEDGVLGAHGQLAHLVLQDILFVYKQADKTNNYFQNYDPSF